MAAFATVTIATTSSQATHHIPGQKNTIATSNDPATPVAMTTNTLLTSTTPTSLPSKATVASNKLGSSAPPMLDSAEAGLPDWPPMLTIFLLSWTVMGWVLAVVLYLTTFPGRVRWADRLLARWRNEASANSGASPNVSHHRHTSLQPRRTSSNRRSTTAIATGLGISVPDELAERPRLRKPRSFDQESLSVRKRKPDFDIASTAPLSFSKDFAEVSPTSSAGTEHQEPVLRKAYLENAKGEAEARSVWDREQVLRSKDGGVSGVLKSVGAVLEFVAVRLAGMTSDQVTGGADEGLLLPMQKNERDPPEEMMSEI